MNGYVPDRNGIDRRRDTREVAAAGVTGTVPPVIDQSVLAAIGERLGCARVAFFVQEALAEAEKASIRLRTAGLAPGEVAETAHQLRGTACSFGLMCIGAAAARIEDDARRGRITTDLLDELLAAIDLTRGAAAGAAVTPA